MDQSTLIQIAFSLYNNKGAYALLLGSGVSRAAGIPTGWEITMDLIRQIASLHGEDCEPDPEKWYLTKFGNAAGYSDLLDRLGKTSTERAGFIKSFIEPNADERSEGKKQPTEAHRAIAKLVASGIVRVIVTTNFDRLIEKAIEDEGIVPTVISTPDAAVGATPIIHSACTVIKLNGDYLDTRSKNTEIELTEYDPRINQLLERVFDEFGLVVCGWSGEWDTGLRSIIEQIKGRRYTCYWAIRGNLNENAKQIAELRAASQFTIEDANTFFSALEEKISAVAELRRPHPLSAELAVVSLKKYVAEEKYRIKLHDLVMDEVKRVCENLSETRFPMGMAPPPTREFYENRVNQYLNELAILAPLLANGCWWGKSNSDELWIKVIERLANWISDGGGFTSLRELRLFPASYALYCAGISAVANKRFDLLRRLLREPRIKLLNGSGEALDHLYLQSVGNPDYFPLVNQRKRRTPLNDIVFEKLQIIFAELLPTQYEFEAAFDQFEYLYALTYAEVNAETRQQNGTEYVWVPPGRFAWRDRSIDHVEELIQSDIEKQKDDWLPIRQGLFAGRHAEVLNMKKLVDNFSSMLGWRW